MAEQSGAGTITVEAALQQAVAHHQAGRLQDAERLYRAILQAQPQHTSANYNLGVIAVQVGQYAAGVPHFKAALEANPGVSQYWLSYIDALIESSQPDAARAVLAQGLQNGLRSATAYLNLGAAYYGLGRPDDAEASYRKALEIDPKYADAHNNLGAILREKGLLAEAEACFQRALKRNPGFAEAHCNAGNVLKDQHKLAQAEASYRQALKIRPDFVEAHINLGIALKMQDRLAEAEDSFRRALALRSELVEAYNGLGDVLQAQDRIPEAEAIYRHGLEIRPDSAELHYNLGVISQKLGQYAEAEHSYRRALEIKADFTKACPNLAALYNEQNRYPEAEAVCRHALKFTTNDVGIYNNLGIAIKELHRLAEAENVFLQALEIQPDVAETHINLATVFQTQGRFPEAEASYRRALELKPDFAGAYSNLLFCLSHDESVDEAVLYAEHVRFGEQFEAPLRASWPQHRNSRDRHRRLHVGLVSADLRHHAVASFIEPVLSQWAGDPTLVLHAYYTHTIEDHVTARLRGHVAHWHAVAGLGDAALADKIQADGIDILIDLSGHTAHNRLPAFARKPAPVQVSWIGTACTTGLQAMDYYLADRHFLPPGRFDDQFTEKIVTLPAGVPYLPPAADAPPVNALPALANGHMTFGSFNRLNKLSRSVIALWAQVLRMAPGSCMLLGAMPESGNYDMLLAWFAEEDIDHERLSFHGRCSMPEYLALHRQVDICLDTFPYNGGTTTLHALWMGVPTLTLAGNTPVGRAGAAGLCHAGLEEFVAQDTDAFVRQAAAWSGRLEELGRIRAQLRERIASSPLGQPTLLAAGLTSALRTMWQRWCAGEATASFEVTEIA